MTSVVPHDDTRDAALAVLRAAPVLGHLDTAALTSLLDAGQRRTFAAGAEFVHADDRTSAVFLIVRGACDVERHDGCVHLDAPALVGEIAALTGAPRTATVRATTAIDAVVIEREPFLAAIATSPEAGQALTDLVADRICAPDTIRQVGRFPVEAVIGRGASGRVFRARHPTLDIPVALKMLSHALALMPGGAAAFVREASLLARLDHPAIVRVLDAFEAHGTFFIVMPWIDGATLREHLDRGTAFTPEQIVAAARETLEALHALHTAGLVHRDIKPSNLLFRSTGGVVLIDLGIAAGKAGGGDDDAAAAGRGLVGTPAYCSPEQILGRPIDGRSDVYSLGCTLYEIVFGEPPFGAAPLEAVIEGHLRGTPSFDRAARTPMPASFLDWLRRLMSRTRTGRPAAADALRSLRAG